MFDSSARYYDALYRFKDYGDAARAIEAAIRAHNPGAASILDVACGTGQHLGALGSGYDAAGFDLNPDLLALARERCPWAKFHQGDMADFSLGRTFDVVTCLFSSIAYVQTKERMFAAVRSMAGHLNPGGLLLIEPWFTPETYWVGHLAANYVDEPDLKISWMYVSERREDLSVLDIHYQVGRADGVEQFRELHELGLFSREDHMAAFAQAGLQATYEEKGFFGRGLYLATAAPER